MSMSDCQLFLFTPKHRLATTRLWRRLLLRYFTCKAPNSSRQFAFSKSQNNYVESPSKQIWELRTEALTINDKDAPFLALYDLSSRIPLLCAVVLPKGNDKRSEEEWEDSEIQIENFIRLKQSKGSIEAIFTVISHGQFFKFFHFSKHDGLVEMAGEGSRELISVMRQHHLQDDAFRLESLLVRAKIDIVRQLFALSAHNEAQTLSLWTEILERHFLTMPDPSHGTQCSCICCQYRQWKMFPLLQEIGEKKTTMLAIRDISQSNTPTVLIAGCWSSGKRAEQDWTDSLATLEEYCRYLSESGQMGRLLYVAQAHGRLVRWHVYHRNIRMQALSPEAGKPPLDAIKDAEVVDRIGAECVKEVLGMFTDTEIDSPWNNL